MANAEAPSTERSAAEPTVDDSKLYERTLAQYPKGIHSKLHLPVTLEGQAFELRIITETRRRAIEVLFHLPTRNYARATLVLGRDSKVELDAEGFIPEHDRHDIDATFKPSLSALCAALEAALESGKVTRGA